MKDDIQKAYEVLKNGGSICYPTDTIWGIGCDATNESAIDKIYALKKKDSNMHLLIIVDSEAMLERYVENPPEVAFDIIELSEKPVTIVFEKGINLPKNLLGEDGSIAIRVSREEFTQKLIQKLRKPIVSTSANIHGKPSPLFYDQISEAILEKVDFVVQYRQEDRDSQAASSIIKITNSGECTIIRT